jgi:DNA-binding transcriptional LysR family regulator|uniref:Probable RuBisCO transcriptional regulator n=2 Tax=Heterosigma akashiwo TaxID=2829 RepID=B2XTB6_HETAK|nr:LysR transcriptional regulator [Heterosigma akashiwo]ABV66014.1 lysR-like transcriptional regulator [Heterosigma akashiwo]ABV70155.1 lysR-like transcriptional regulator [Heterosigma akashiwo]BBA18221.1 photosystem I assembly protein Ycf3 [Heterosigma akashiwo]BBA18360.1 photosystem I assembly protein Ycf3 [Heterosigma akashiwo]BBA18499.1 photosystem I assembly protein Ycf3 [Heterosigma akashiwo]
MSDLPFTLDQLRILRAIAIEGSFKKAAESLYLSQPALSLQIKNLEKKLNFALFERQKNTVKLTDSGQLLLRYGNRILGLCEETYRALLDLRNLQSGTLIVGASQTTGTYLVPRLIGLFRQRYPQVTIQLQVHSTRRVAWAVANGQIDIGIIGGAIPYELNDILKITPYAEDELALILPKSHSFSEVTKIKKDDLYSLQFITLDKNSTIRRVIDDILQQNEIDTRRFKIEMELNSIESIKNAVQSGLGAAFVSVSAIRKELELGLIHWAKIENVTVKRFICIIENPNRYKSKACEQFFDF